MEKKLYINKEEQEKCRNVVNAYAEEFDDEPLLVLEAGRFGFVKLQYYNDPYGFEDALIFHDSFSLFQDLWEEWLHIQLLNLTKDTKMAEMEYEDMFRHLAKEKQEELMEKRNYFAAKANMESFFPPL